MSRLTGGPPSFASRTTFDALDVDTGEESEEEEVHEAPPPETFVSCFSSNFARSELTRLSSSSQLEVKPSKSAIKKAQKLARVEKKQRRKALAKSQPELSSSPENSIASSEVTPSREAVPLPEPSEPSNLNDSYILPTIPLPTLPQPAEGSLIKMEKVPVEINRTTPEAIEHPTPTPPVAPDPPFFEPIPAAPLVTPQLTEKSLTKPMTLPLHEGTSAKDAEKVKKMQSFLTRALWTCIMISGFIGM